MLPVLLVIGPLTITTFGVFFAFAILSGLYYFVSFCRKAGFNEEKILDYSLLSLISGFLSGRLGFIALHPGAPLIGSGFILSFGLVGFFLFTSWFLRKEGWSLLKIGDGLLTAIFISVSFTFLGLFFGLKTDLYYLLFFSTYLSVFLWRVSTKRERKTGYYFYFLSTTHFTFFCIFLILKNATFSEIVFNIALAIFFMLKFIGKGYFTMDSNLPADFILKIKERLYRYKSKIESEEKQLSKENASLEGGVQMRSPDPADEASETIGQTFVNSSLFYIRDLKKQIDKALDRIKIGKYGFCEVCGKSIEKARLEAFPEATKCLLHEEQTERKSS